MLVYSGPEVRAAVLDQVKQMGVNVVRVQFVWRNIALKQVPNPSDPEAYGDAWANWDSLVLEAHKRGIRVLGTITGPAPTWYAGMTGQYYSGSRYPDAKAFGQFVAAVGRRYSGEARAGASVRASGLFDPPPCTPVPPLITCTPEGPVITPPPPDDGGGGGGGGSSPPPPPSGSGEQSPPPPPGSGEPTPPPTPGTTLPRIETWSIYNEPNHPLFVSPQRSKGTLESASIYRALYRAGWTALAKTGHRRDTILIGEVLPIGSNQNRDTSTTSPLRFARELFCLNGAGKRHPGCGGHFAALHASGWALHAYYRKTGPFSRPPGTDDLTPASVGKLRALLAKARRKGRLAGGQALWDTENGSQTRPPDPKGATLARQARFINEAEYLAWRTPYMRSFSQYLLTDEQPVWAFQSGLVFSNGKPKPAFGAYRLPIYVKKAGRGVVVWGHVPGRGVVTIAPAGQKAVKVRANGYFTKRLAKRARSYRLVFGAWVSRSASPT
ncbi:MAG: hypothetical protein QOJ29_3103 [Thermoleophilaceae bacterium]|nr:hypothetical protein [Thermoleophilaceae bacterium]